jgi:hypothetical protein
MARKPKAPLLPAEIERWKELIELAALTIAMSTSGPNSGRAHKPPSRRRLSRIAQHLRRWPQLRVHPAMAPFLDNILDQCVAADEPEAIGPDAIDLAFKMGTSGKNGVSPSEARRYIVEVRGMRPETVRQAQHSVRKRKRQEGAKITISDTPPGLSQKPESEF